MIDFYDEGNLVGVFPAYRSQHTQRGSHRVAPAFDGQLHDIFGIKIDGIGRERGPGAVFDPLIHGENGEVPLLGKTTVIIHRLHVSKHGCRPVGHEQYPFDKIRSRQMQLIFGKNPCMIQ